VGRLAPWTIATRPGDEGHCGHSGIGAGTALRIKPSLGFHGELDFTPLGASPESGISNLGGQCL